MTAVRGHRRSRRSTPRRAAGAVLVVLGALGVAACQPLAPDPPPPAAPAFDAPAGTWRAAAEAAVVPAHQSLLGTAPSAAVRRSWADQVVRGTSWADLLLAQVRTAAGTRSHLGRLADRYGLAVPGGTLDADAGALRGGTRSHDAIVAGWWAAPEVRSGAGSDAAWIDLLHQSVLGRPATTDERTTRLAQLAGGTTHAEIARQLWAGAPFRSAAVAAIADQGGATPLPNADRDALLAGLTGSGGDLRPARSRAAAVALDRSGAVPPPIELGIPGDSVPFGLAYYRGSVPVGPVAGDNGGMRIGCGIMAARNWRLQDSQGNWVLPGDQRCAEAIEGELVAASRSDVMLWVAGAWEFLPMRSPGGTVVPARSAQMREVLANEMVSRIDAWAGAGVRRVLLSDWACNGPESRWELRDPAYRAWFRSVLDEVVRRRPAVASVAVAPAQVCSPESYATETNSRLRHGDHHWPDPEAARWGWSVWYSPALADLPGLVTP